MNARRAVSPSRWKGRFHGIAAALLIAVAAGWAGVMFASPAPAQEVTVYKSPWCGCCGGWVDHMRDNGFSVTVHETEDLDPIRAEHGVSDELMSCHTAVVDGYTIEGHVPAADVARLLREKPEARGLAVPGMPAGSPGMEAAGREPYDVLLFADDGDANVFASH